MADTSHEHDGTPTYGDTHDHEYRAHYDQSPDRYADRSYEQLRPAYQVGHLAASNRDNFGRDFEEIEPDLQRSWLEELRATHGDWESVRHFARHAYERARGGASVGVSGATFGSIDQRATTLTDTHDRPSYSDPIPAGDPEQVAGEDRAIPGRE